VKLLVCGSRRSFSYRALVWSKLDEWYANKKAMSPKDKGFELEIIEGCCQYSADRYAEEWAKINNIKCNHYPANGKPLLRNIQMLKDCDSVIAFWDFWSYGTSFVISRATAMKKPITIIRIERGVEVIEKIDKGEFVGEL